MPKSPRRQQSLGHRFWTFKNNIIYRICQAVAGLSLGEYTALAVAGVFYFETGLKVVKLRGEAMQARNGSRDATTGASLPCFTNLMIFHAAVRDCSCFGMESAHTLL